jgi:hypothetical protein
MSLRVKRSGTFAQRVPLGLSNRRSLKNFTFRYIVRFISADLPFVQSPMIDEAEKYKQG